MHEPADLTNAPRAADPVPAYLLGFVVIGIALTLAGPALSHLRDRMGTDDGGIAWVFVGQSLGYIVGTAVAGRGLDRGHGHRRWVAAMGVIVASVLMVAAAPSLWMLAVAFAVLGGASGVSDVSGNTLVVWSRPDGAGAALNGLHLCFAIGAVVSPLVVDRALRWSDSVWPVAVPLAAVALVAGVGMMRRPVPARTRLDTVERSRAGGARSLHVGLVAAFFFAYVATEAGFGGWIHTYVEQIHYGDRGTATGVVTVFWVGFMMGRVAATALARRVSAGWLVAGSMVLAVVASALLLPFQHGGPMLWVVTFLFAAAIAPQYASMMGFAETHLALSGRNTAMLVGGSGVGGLLMPWTLGQLFDAVGPTSLPWVTFVATVVTAVVALVAGRAVLGAQRPPETSMNEPVV